MNFCRGELLAQQISKFSPMSICESLAVQKRVFADGPARRDEAEALFVLSLTFEKTDTAWKCAFSQAITDHLLGQGQQYGYLEFDGEDWLIHMLATKASIDRTLGFELLKSVLQQAQNASEKLVRFALKFTAHCLSEPAQKSNTTHEGRAAMA